MIYLKQNIFSADRQNVRENCNLFIFFEQTGKAITAIYYDHFTGSQLSLNFTQQSLINLKIDMIVVN